MQARIPGARRRGASPSNGAGYLATNERSWDYWASVGSISSQPIGRLDTPAAQIMLDPDGWLPWREIRHVLCLGAGGGQQGPAFAMLGRDVTIVDLSERQLKVDRQVAHDYGLTLRCIKGDMSRLDFLEGGSFDLVYQPISSCYVPDITALYREVHRMLRPQGLYRVEHWNPAHMYLWAADRWGARGYTLPASGSPSDPIDMTVAQDPAGEALLTSRIFPHSLQALIGSLCEVGFAVRRFAEDAGGDATAPIGSDKRLSAFVPPFIRLLARKTPRRRRPVGQAARGGGNGRADLGSAGLGTG